MRMTTNDILPSSTPLRRLQLIVWPVLTVLYFGFDLGRQGAPVWVELIWRSLVWGSVGLIVSTLLAQLYRYTKARSFQVLPFVVAALIGSILGGFAWLFLFACVDGLLALEGGWSLPTQWQIEQLFVEWTDYSLMLLVWHGVLFSAIHQARSHQQERRSLELEQQATEAQLIALRAQLNPHFLFNALNSAMALVHDSPERAEEVLQRLSDVLRNSLSKTGTFVSLHDEIELVSDYLGIEKIRFEEGLQIEFDIDKSLGSLRIPPGLLLPLVDNAIKHGLDRSEAAMRLSLRVTRSHEQLEIVVRNSGHITKRDHERSLGLGLANVQQRIAAEFGKLGTFSLSELNGNVEARLQLPLDQRSNT